MKMNVVVDITIHQCRERVWQAITDIAQCPAMISAIDRVDIIEQPQQGLVGLKWQEVRQVFGKSVTETLWITEAVEQQFYTACAQSHGVLYVSRLSLDAQGESTKLTMSMCGEPQSLKATWLYGLMSVLIRPSMKKALAEDLRDIKTFVERSASVFATNAGP